MNQWASLFAEQGLGVDKAVGESARSQPVRLVHGGRPDLVWAFRERAFRPAGVGVLRPWSPFCSTVVAVFSPNRFVALLGCAFTGFAVALLWPGTLSLSATVLPQGGTMLFGTLAFFGNIGSTLGPQVVSWPHRRRET
jgi:MFS family permease